MKFIRSLLWIIVLGSTSVFGQKETAKQNVEAEHGMIGVNTDVFNKQKVRSGTLWFPQAKLGLFIHWGVSSVNNLDVSWPMIPGRGLANKELSDNEIADIIQKKNYNKYTSRPLLTPNDYWQMAKKFKAEDYDPEKWIIAAKEAGFTYAVLTARHHEGFALWPSSYGNFSTKNYMGGKDLIKPFVEACKKHGLRVGLYYSPPDWYFDKEYMNFMYYKTAKNQKFPRLDADLKPRTVKPDSADLAAHQKLYAAHVAGQLRELLTNYGKIDLLWFDGAPPIPNGKNVISREELFKMQPDIVLNPRLHGEGDFRTFERVPPNENPKEWAEFCNTWTFSWANSTTLPFRAPAFILGQLALCSSWNVNYLLGVGPNSKGEMSAEVYKNMDIVKNWMNHHKEAIMGTNELPTNESANVPATAKGNVRFLFSIPEFKSQDGFLADQLPARDKFLRLKSNKEPKSVILTGLNRELAFKFQDNQIEVELPATCQSNLVDVVKVTF